MLIITYMMTVNLESNNDGTSGLMMNHYAIGVISKSNKLQIVIQELSIEKKGLFQSS